ncbi:MAG: hypothetical protein JW810_14350 [Sedimentisphaerales bacterium]|nr:hypothetical protein [Sedimentisphaerales bacterium]
MAGTFGDDVRFLKKHMDVQVLTGGGGKALAAVSADLQGRVLTSSANGPGGLSYGWINRELIASGENNPHINAYGGEDRFWLGPEGGQYSIFFAPGDPFDLEHWFTPPPINEAPYEIAESGDDFVVFTKDMQVGNYSRFAFSLKLKRQIRLLPEEEACRLLDVNVPDGVAMVAFQSENTITNTGPAPWRKQTGLLSVWILGMFNPSEATTVVVPYRPGPPAQLGPIVNDAYFGKVPADRLVVKDEAIYFSGDGRYRSKIGLTSRRAKNLLGSYDARNQVLTLVSYNQPAGPADYVNSMWQIQDEPYAGDAVNSYNDGPASPGAKPLGPFYELETSSPAVELSPGGSLTHIHRTFHFQGPPPLLDAIARATLGVSIDRIRDALK